MIYKISVSKNSLSVNEFISNGELFQKIKNFPYELFKIYVAELAIVLGKKNLRNLNEHYTIRSYIHISKINYLS